MNGDLINRPRVKPGQGWQGLNAPSLFNNPVKSKRNPRTSAIPSPNLAKPKTTPQQMTGRVGGAMTTAYRTQPLSAQFGWLGSQAQRNKAKPANAMMSWLNSSLAPQITQMLMSAIGQQENPFNKSLPQNMTRKAIQRRR